MLFPTQEQMLKLDGVRDLAMLELTGTINIKTLIYVVDKTTGMYLTDASKLTWVDINALAIDG